MSTTIAKPVKVAIIGDSGTYGKGILPRAEQIGVEVMVVTRSPHKFKDVKPTTTVVEAQLDEEEKLKKAFGGLRWRHLGARRRQEDASEDAQPPARLERIKALAGDKVYRHGLRTDDDAGREAWGFPTHRAPPVECAETLWR